MRVNPRSSAHLVAFTAAALALSACDPRDEPDDVLLEAPSVTLEALSDTSVRVTWSMEAEEGVAGYRVYLDGDPHHDTTSKSFIDTGLAPETSYCYQVLAYDDAGNESALSPWQCVTTLAEGTTGVALTVSRGGSGSGSISSTPAGIHCGNTCSATFEAGATVVLQAAPAAGSTFAGWSGCASSDGQTCSLVLNAPTTVTATFEATSADPVLTVEVDGSGAGSVTSSPAGITCGSTCSASYESGTAVTLTANPAALSGSVFSGWSGCDATTDNVCEVTLASSRTVTATFDTHTPPPRLTVTKDGAGSGTVVSSPENIDCGVLCAGYFDEGTSITLSATPASGSVFDGWSGCTEESGGDCIVILNEDTTVTATFVVESLPILTVGKSGSGTGTVTSTPAGINCGATCETGFTRFTDVRLTASPSGSSTFSGWAGCDTVEPGTGDCLLNMGAHRYVAATFTGQQTTNLPLTASNCPMYNSLDSSVANTAYPECGPAVGIHSYWNLGGGSFLAFAGLARFNHSAITGRTIVSATLGLEVQTLYATSNKKNFQISAVATAWNPNTVTWNTMANFQYYTASWQTHPYPVSSSQTYAIDVTAMVQNWANGTWVNNGIAFQSVDYFWIGNYDSWDGYSFYYPTLTVTYY